MKDTNYYRGFAYHNFNKMITYIISNLKTSPEWYNECIDSINNKYDLNLSYNINEIEDYLNNNHYKIKNSLYGYMSEDKEIEKFKDIVTSFKNFILHHDNKDIKNIPEEIIETKEEPKEIEYKLPDIEKAIKEKVSLLKEFYKPIRRYILLELHIPNTIIDDEKLKNQEFVISTIINYLSTFITNFHISFDKERYEKMIKIFDKYYKEFIKQYKNRNGHEFSIDKINKVSTYIIDESTIEVPKNKEITEKIDSKEIDTNNTSINPPAIIDNKETMKQYFDSNIEPENNNKDIQSIENKTSEDKDDFNSLDYISFILDTIRIVPKNKRIEFTKELFLETNKIATKYIK